MDPMMVESTPVGVQKRRSVLAMVRAQLLFPLAEHTLALGIWDHNRGGPFQKARVS